MSDQRGTVTVVVGGLYGSESKGAMCALLAAEDIEQGRRHVGIRVGGSQAGHTAYDPQGRRWALRHVPVAAVVDPDAQLVIARGSEIDVEVLADEIARLEAAGIPVVDRLSVDGNATVIDPEHKEAEAGQGLTDRLGSTAKGVGAARAARIMRTARRYGDLDPSLRPPVGVDWDTPSTLHRLAGNGARLVVEGVQGQGLSMYGPHYPKSTSSACDAATFLGMAGLSVWGRGIRGDVSVVVVARPYPIRVAGNSGPMRDETTWEALGLPPEYTTVTKKVRRVGAWDPDLLLEAVRANGAPSPRVGFAMGMLDHRFPEVAGKGWDGLSPESLNWLAKVEFYVGARLVAVGTGPTSWTMAGAL
jgi:adenylosuccinate synthase